MSATPHEDESNSQSQKPSDGESKETEVSSQESQTIRFQIPPPGVQPQPVFQISSQGAQPQPLTQPSAQDQSGTLKNVESLIESVQEATKEGNRSESQVPAQIILIASAILAAVGVASFDTHSRHIAWPTGVLLLIAVIGLGVSLLSGVLHFMTERKFWYRNRERGIFALNILSAVSNPVDRDNAALQASGLMSQGSSRGALWLQVTSFLIGVSALVVLVVAKICGMM